MMYLLPFFIVFILFLIITPGKLFNKPYVWLWETFIPKIQMKFSKTKEVIVKGKDGKNTTITVETNIISKALSIPLKMLGCLFCICHWTAALALICIYTFGIKDFDLLLCIKNFIYSGVVSTFIFRALMQR